jgi:LmbE family N-acetylglucosaminyl deacetylase
MGLIWQNDSAEVFVPSDFSATEALGRTTHLAVGAHADDLEIMCWDGILKCFRKPGKWFTGVTVTDGAGSPRSGTYAHFSDVDMVELRRREQRAAAMTGEYSAVVSLMYASSEARESKRESLIIDLCKLLKATQPEVLYTHNLVDKHNTHLAISTAVVEAARRIELKPKVFLGCEVWRGLDWIPDSRKVMMDVSAHPGLTQSLVGLYDSQIAAGKRYDLATGGRKRANATFLEAYEADAVTHLEYAMDMLPLLNDPVLSYQEYVGAYIEHFQNNVFRALERYH